MKYIPDEEICRDIVQDIFIIFLKNIHNFDDSLSAKVFFYRSIRNECINRINHRTVHCKYLERQLSALELTDSLLDNVIRKEAAFLVHKTLKHLSPTERKVIIMAMDDMSNPQIAEKLSVSVNTVKTLKARAYAILRNSLKELQIIFILMMMSFQNKIFMFYM